jgi:polysaccharide deacetylase 2 family uncharacterized protein YibQ
LVDRDVIQDLHHERSRWGMQWIESDRQLHADPRKVGSLLDRITAAARKQGCTVMRRHEDAHEALLEIGKGPFLLQRLQFLPAFPTAALPQNPEVAFVIDDVAYDLAPMDHFASLGVPLTFAILPRDKNTRQLADKADGMKFAVILHLPMEPLDLAHNNPGGAALYLNMSPDQLRQQFDKDVASVPHIQGINNHMGSAFTEDAAKMHLVLGWVKERKLFFLDSHTSVHSIVPKVARSVGVPCLVNETFLDNEDTAESIEKQLDIVMKLALKRKRTIAIGHYRRKHLVEALANKLPEFQAHGIHLVGLPTFYPKS